MNELYTIGHSNHSIERFIELLQLHAVSAVGDVRSHPYSSYAPQFDREALQKTLKRSGIAYVFLGRELGPRSDDPACYLDGKAQYTRLALTETFRSGVRRLCSGMESYRIALMCAEKDPVSCHRMILVCRALRSMPISIGHILGDGSVESLDASEQRLIRTLKIPQLRLFEDVEGLVQRAYDVQGDRIAYVRADGPRDETEEQDTWEE